MISNDYFDAALLIGESNIQKISQKKFLELDFETKVGMLINKITNEALEDNNLKILDISDKFLLAKVAFFHHWTGVLMDSYLKKKGKKLNSEWLARSFIGYFSLNKNFTDEYYAEQYSITNKQFIGMLDEAKKNKIAKEITETYSTLISAYIDNKGLNFKKNINFKEIFKNQLLACFEMIGN